MTVLHCGVGLFFFFCAFIIVVRLFFCRAHYCVDPFLLVARLVSDYFAIVQIKFIACFACNSFLEITT